MSDKILFDMEKQVIIYRRKIYLSAAILLLALFINIYFHLHILFMALSIIGFLVYFINIIIDFANLKFEYKDEMIDQVEKDKEQMERVHQNEVKAMLDFIQKERNKLDDLKKQALYTTHESVQGEIKKIQEDAEIKIKVLLENEEARIQEIESKYQEQIKELEAKKGNYPDWIPKEEWIKRQQKKVEKGRQYEEYVGKYFEAKGYHVDYRGIKLGKKDGGIDLIAIKENEIILIQCKNWNGNTKIKQSEIRKFYGDCSKYVEDNHLLRDEVQYRYVIPSKNLLDIQAEKYFISNHLKIRYVVIPFLGDQVFA